ncbi:MAG: hypothetical protein AAGF11_17545 [Myxococcota bacterium]
MRPIPPVCIVLALLSLAWSVASGLGAADRLWVEWWGATSSPIWRVTEGIEAGTAAGKWTMLAVAASMVDWRVLAGLLGLEVLAEGLLLARADLSVGLVSVVPSLLVLGLVVRARSEPEQPPRHGSSTVLQLACGLFLATGVIIIVDFHGPVFIPYRGALEALDPSPPWGLVALAYARIAVGFSVHYGALLLVLRRRGADPVVLRGAMVAQLAWFLPDSAACLVNGAVFNVVMINLPSMGLFWLAWWIVWRGRARPGPATP